MPMLIVDDMLGHELAELVKERLEEMQAPDEILVAESELEALDCLKRKTFDVISLDGLGGGGLRILEKLVREGHRGPVVFYSADPESVERAKRCGARGMTVFALHKAMTADQEDNDSCTILTWRNFMAGLTLFPQAA